MSKWEMFFGKLVSTDMKLTLSRLIRVKSVQHFRNCLGLPSFMGRKRLEVFKTIKDKVWSKLIRWKATLFL